jgi:hypothetical protein
MQPKNLPYIYTTTTTNKIYTVTRYRCQIRTVDSNPADVSQSSINSEANNNSFIVLHVLEESGSRQYTQYDTKKKRRCRGRKLCTFRFIRLTDSTARNIQFLILYKRISPSQFQVPWELFAGSIRSKARIGSNNSSTE